MQRTKFAAWIGASRLITVVVGLEGTLLGDAKVGELLLVKRSELNTQLAKVETSDLLIKLLGEEVNTDGVLLGLGPESDLGENLVGERRGHNERRVSASATEVNKTTRGEEDDVTAVVKLEAINLSLDVDDLLGVLVQPSNVDLSIEVANVANDGVLGHLNEVLSADNIAAASGSDEDVRAGSSILHGGNLKTLHSGLESVDGVNLGNDDTSTHSAERVSASLTNITITSNDGSLTGDHDISGTLDTVQKGLAATIQVVELGLGDGVVNVDSGELQSTLLHTLVQTVNTSGGLLGQT
jgi:hypothetical protein